MDDRTELSASQQTVRCGLQPALSQLTLWSPHIADELVDHLPVDGDTSTDEGLDELIERSVDGRSG